MEGTRAAAVSPFVVALGDGFRKLAPAVRRHLEQAAGASRFVGSIRRSWRHGGPLGWFLARILHLDFGASGSTRFELRNELLVEPAGTVAMVWQRTLRDGRGSGDQIGMMRWDPRRGALVDTIGPRRAIRVELVPSVEDGTLSLVSGRQWLRVAGIPLPLPRALVGSARVREWEEPDGRIVLFLAVSHPWLGEYTGYEAILGPDEQGSERR